MASESAKLYVAPSDARNFVAAILEGNGVNSVDSKTIARCLVEADLRGVDTHGMNRMPSYMARIRAGVLNAAGKPTVTQVTPVVAHIDGNNCFGFVSATEGMERGIAMAKEFGIGMVSIKHSNHFGMSASFVLQAVRERMMSLVFTNSSPALPAFGGMSKLLGVSPIAAGAPAGDTVPFVLDMAPSTAARGKIYKALRRGEKIPTDWALDGEGKETDDPAAALEGVMLPMGGPKGSALAIMMDVFSGVLSGAAFGGGVTGPYDPSKEADVGHFLVVVKPDLFMSLGDFKQRMDTVYHKVTGSEKAHGVERIYYPGEIEIELQKTREREGIPLVQAELDALNKEAGLVSVPALKVSESKIL